MNKYEFLVLLVTLLQRPRIEILKVTRGILRLSANSITVLFGICFPLLAGASQEVVDGIFPVETAIFMLVYLAILAYNRHMFIKTADKITVQIKKRFGEDP